MNDRSTETIRRAEPAGRDEKSSATPIRHLIGDDGQQPFPPFLGRSCAEQANQRSALKRECQKREVDVM